MLIVLRLLVGVGLAGFGAWLGGAASDLIWGFIYGIGDSVVSDETYYELVDIVPSWGRLAGACSGFFVAFLPGRWPVGAFALTHLVSVFAGVMGGMVVWWAGLAGYLGVHGVAVIASNLVVLIHASRSADA